MVGVDAATVAVSLEAVSIPASKENQEQHLGLRLLEKISTRLALAEV